VKMKYYFCNSIRFPETLPMIMKIFNSIKSASIGIVLICNACGEIVSYPDTPVITYEAFTLYRGEDILQNPILLGRLEIGFTDGDGNIGLNQPDSTATEDSIKYNLFLTIHEIKNLQPVKVEGPEGEFKYRIPYIERTGQNKTLKGTIFVDIEYKTIDFDTIFYTFYLMDRAFNRSNTDTTDVLIFTGLEP